MKRMPRRLSPKSPKGQKGQKGPKKPLTKSELETMCTSKKCSLKKCGNGTESCCQAITQSGLQCTRKAVFNLDLTKGKKVFGYEVIPPMNCCFLCSQHAAVWAAYGITKLGMTLNESRFSWEEYIALHPEYVENLQKQMIQ